MNSFLDWEIITVYVRKIIKFNIDGEKLRSGKHRKIRWKCMKIIAEFWKMNLAKLTFASSIFHPALPSISQLPRQHNISHTAPPSIQVLSVTGWMTAKTLTLPNVPLR